jgi:hypothetical protein
VYHETLGVSVEGGKHGGFGRVGLVLWGVINCFPTGRVPAGTVQSINREVDMFHRLAQNETFLPGIGLAMVFPRFGTTLLRLGAVLLRFGAVLLRFGVVLLRFGAVLLGFGTVLLGCGVFPFLGFRIAVLGFGTVLIWFVIVSVGFCWDADATTRTGDRGEGFGVTAL